MPQRATNTVVEGLNKLGKSIFDMKADPDATPQDIHFLVGLETQILQHMRAPHDAAVTGQQGQGMPGAPVDPSMMQGPGPQPGGPGGPGQGDPSQLAAALSAAAQGGGMPPGGGGGPQPFGPANVPGLRNVPQLPPIDELRRMTQPVR